MSSSLQIYVDTSNEEYLTEKNRAWGIVYTMQGKCR